MVTYFQETLGVESDYVSKGKPNQVTTSFPSPSHGLSPNIICIIVSSCKIQTAVFKIMFPVR